MEPIVQTTGGAVRGTRSSGGFAFLGIPYAADPVGEFRLLAPAPHGGWDGVREATAYGATAPQPHQDFTIIPEPIIPGAEYLNLNVFTPDPGGARLPVFVWIHGGGFLSGCSASPWYRGDSFARDGVVTVTINYRLGVEGFGMVEGAPPNRGVLDWIAALEWVQANIGNFGGDPSTVTIGGQSAGGIVCTTLLAIPRARGLFHRAIAMSGPAPRLPERGDAARAAQRIADVLGLAATRTDLAEVPVDRLVEAQNVAFPMPGASDATLDSDDTPAAFAGGMLVMGPILDGDLLPGQPQDAFRAGAGSDVPLLLGATSEEIVMMSLLQPLEPDAAKKRLLGLGLSDAAADSYGARYAGTAVGHALTDRMFRLGALAVAEARNEATAPSATYHYDFRWRSSMMDGLFGACHCLDIPFAFDTADATDSEALLAGAPRSLVEAMHGAFVRFVRSGAPGWPAYDVPTRTSMIFDESSTTADDVLAFERQCWAGVA